MIKYAGGFLFALLLLLGGLRLLQPNLVPTALGTDDDSRVAITFWPAQTGTEGPYRFTTGDSQLQLRGLERWDRAVLAEGAPHAVRSVGVIAPALLIAAQALVRIWAALPMQKTGVFLLAGLALCGFYNLNLYFSTVPTSPAVWEKFYTEETALAQYASTAPGPVVVPRTVMETAVGAYLLANKQVQIWDVGQTEGSFSPGTKILIPNGATAEEYLWIATHFPDIQRLPHSPFPGTVQPTFWSYTVWR